METETISLNVPGKTLLLTRDAMTTTVTAKLGGKDYGMTMRFPDEVSLSRRLEAEERLVRAGVKSLMFHELLGTLDRKEWPARIKERYPGERDYLEACDKWMREHTGRPTL
jgi:hypothetical protein